MKESARKYIVIILFAVLAAAIIGAVVLITKQREQTPEETAAYEEITMVLPTYGYVPENMEQITQDLNRISMEKCAVKVNFLFTGSTELNQSMLLRLRAGESIDLMPCLEEAGLVTLMSEDLLNPLDPLIDSYAPAIRDLFYPRIWQALGHDGEVYALTAIGSQSDWGGIMFNGEVLAAGNIGYDTVTREILKAQGNDIERVDAVITPILYELKESNELLSDGSSVSLKQLIPGLSDYGGIFSQMPVIGCCGYGNLLGVVMDGTDRVVNLFETPEYHQKLELLRRWNESGYIYHLNRTIDEDPATVYAGKDKLGLFTSLGIKVERPNEAVVRGDDVYFPFVRNRLTTDKFRVGTWVIPRTASHPEAAMKILNLMYTDEEYVRAYHNRSDSALSGEVPLEWMFGNTLLTDASFEESLKQKEDYASMEFADYFGFTYDPSACAEEIGALQAILDEYLPDLENGIVGNVEDTLEELNLKLYDAGLEKVLADKQKQLEEWIAAQ